MSFQRFSPPTDDSSHYDDDDDNVNLNNDIDGNDDYFDYEECDDCYDDNSNIYYYDDDHFIVGDYNSEPSQDRDYPFGPGNDDYYNNNGPPGYSGQPRPGFPFRRLRRGRQGPPQPGFPFRRGRRGPPQPGFPFRGGRPGPSQLGFPFSFRGGRPGPSLFGFPIRRDQPPWANIQAQGGDTINNNSDIPRHPFDSYVTQKGTTERQKFLQDLSQKQIKVASLKAEMGKLVREQNEIMQQTGIVNANLPQLTEIETVIASLIEEVEGLLSSSFCAPPLEKIDVPEETRGKEPPTKKEKPLVTEKSKVSAESKKAKEKLAGQEQVTPVVDVPSGKLNLPCAEINDDKFHERSFPVVESAKKISDAGDRSSVAKSGSAQITSGLSHGSSFPVVESATKISDAGGRSSVAKSGSAQITSGLYGDSILPAADSARTNSSSKAGSEAEKSKDVAVIGKTENSMSYQGLGPPIGGNNSAPLQAQGNPSGAVHGHNYTAPHDYPGAPKPGFPVTGGQSPYAANMQPQGVCPPHPSYAVIGKTENSMSYQGLGPPNGGNNSAQLQAQGNPSGAVHGHNYTAPQDYPGAPKPGFPVTGGQSPYATNMQPQGVCPPHPSYAVIGKTENSMSYQGLGPPNGGNNSAQLQAQGNPSGAVHGHNYTAPQDYPGAPKPGFPVTGGQSPYATNMQPQGVCPPHPSYAVIGKTENSMSYQGLGPPNGGNNSAQLQAQGNPSGAVHGHNYTAPQDYPGAPKPGFPVTGGQSPYATNMQPQGVCPPHPSYAVIGKTENSMSYQGLGPPNGGNNSAQLQAQGNPSGAVHGHNYTAPQDYPGAPKPGFPVTGGQSPYATNMQPQGVCPPHPSYAVIGKTENSMSYQGLGPPNGGNNSAQLQAQGNPSGAVHGHNYTAPQDYPGAPKPGFPVTGGQSPYATNMQPQGVCPPHPSYAVIGKTENSMSYQGLGPPNGGNNSAQLQAQGNPSGAVHGHNYTAPQDYPGAPKPGFPVTGGQSLYATNMQPQGVFPPHPSYAVIGKTENSMSYQGLGPPNGGNNSAPLQAQGNPSGAVHGHNYTAPQDYPGAPKPGFPVTGGQSPYATNMQPQGVFPPHPSYAVIGKTENSMSYQGLGPPNGGNNSAPLQAQGNPSGAVHGHNYTAPQDYPGAPKPGFPVTGGQSPYATNMQPQGVCPPHPSYAVIGKTENSMSYQGLGPPNGGNNSASLQAQGNPSGAVYGHNYTAPQGYPGAPKPGFPVTGGQSPYVANMQPQGVCLPYPSYAANVGGHAAMGQWGLPSIAQSYDQSQPYQHGGDSYGQSSVDSTYSSSHSKAGDRKSQATDDAESKQEKGYTKSIDQQRSSSSYDDRMSSCDGHPCENLAISRDSHPRDDRTPAHGNHSHGTELKLILKEKTGEERVDAESKASSVPAGKNKGKDSELPDIQGQLNDQLGLRINRSSKVWQVGSKMMLCESQEKSVSLSERFEDEPKGTYFNSDDSESTKAAALLASVLGSEWENISGSGSKSLTLPHQSGPARVESLPVNSRTVHSDDNDDEPSIASRKVILPSKSDVRIVSQSPVFRKSQHPEMKVPRKRPASPLLFPVSKERRVFSEKRSYSDLDALLMRSLEDIAPEICQALCPDVGSFDTSPLSQAVLGGLNVGGLQAADRAKSPVMSDNFNRNSVRKSPDRQTLRSTNQPFRRKSPDRRKSISPSRRRSRSPDRRRLPDRHRSPDRLMSKSTDRHRPRSPDRRRSRSPDRRRSRSPDRQRSRSPDRRRSRLPDRRRSRI